MSENEPVLAVPLCDAKQHIRCFHDEENASIVSYIKAATTWFERRTNRKFISANQLLTLDRFPCGDIRLLPAPVSEIVEIKYIAADGTETTLDDDHYTLDSYSTVPRIRPAYGVSWPATRCESSAVRITFVAGYGESSDDVPDDAKQAIKFLVDHYWRNRSAVEMGSFVPVPMAVESIAIQLELPEVV